ncbi:TRAP transporter substrate-binding protein [Aquibaculum arenosum]|uniref:TRAP transporter substrate-binding protein n=1 Tax=Aquibaculum arenosum TaxID=3032591 RepID=A0ABT5YNA8_9PROT|nr:TRAP transporter substrate-binding protein [Fodinicurvata sp. CAU 1616]MDF2096456.1 TRAP transporter substrate-binding protein [Fodinicurvata sp. CAU 1616]
MTRWKYLVPAVAFGLLAGFSTQESEAQGLDMQFGTTSPPGNMQSMSAEEFARRVNEKLGDAGTVTVYTDSQLGSDREMLQKLKLGTQDMSQPSTIMSTIVPEFGLFDLPYLVASREHMRCIGEEIVWPELAPKVEEAGYKLIGIWENGFRHISNNVRPINTPEDLDGVKLRVPQGVWRVRMFEAYGANPTPMAFSEVFVGLQTGVIDGQENPYSNIYAGRFQEVQTYLTETRHVYTPSFPAASLRRFESYPEEVQEALLEAGRETQDWTYEEAAQLEEETKQKLLDAGMEFNVSDREAFVAGSQSVYDIFAEEVPGGAELIERALALADGC